MQSTIYYEDGTSEAFYDTFNYDLLNGRKLLNKALLDYASVTEEMVIERLNQIIEVKLWGACSTVSETQCYEEDLFDNTKLENFINEEGKLGFFTNQFHIEIEKGFPFENTQEAFSSQS